MATYNAKTLTLVKGDDTYIIDPLQGNETAFIDRNVTIHLNDWTLANGVWSYTYTDAKLVRNATVDVSFKDGIRGGLVGDLKFTKNTGTITFVTDEAPIGDIPLLVRILDTIVGGVYPVDADLIATDAVPDASTVQEAFEELEDRTEVLEGLAIEGFEVNGQGQLCFVTETEDEEEEP